MRQRAHVDPKHIDDVIGGVVTPKDKQGANLPRLAVLQAGFPHTVPAVQLNRMCGSAQQAIHFGSQAIASGDMDLVIAGGCEMMSVEKMGSDASMPALAALVSSGFPYQLLHQGQSAELVAERYGVTRAECDALAAESHRRAAAAARRGLFARSIAPVPVRDDAGAERLVSADEGIRDSVDPAAIAKLKTIFKPEGGVVTAGNASQVSDGAAAVLLCSGPKADALGLRKRARIITRAVVGSDPELMLDGVIAATRKALAAARLTIDDIDAFEVNEAFASVVLAWAKELKPRDGMARVNPNGGAIAHGHPLGASGAVLMAKLVDHLEATGGRYGLQTMCIGHGQATATIIERVGAAGQQSPVALKSRL